MDNRAVGRRHSTTDALDRAGLAHVGVACPFVLADGTLQGTDGVAYVEVVAESVGSVARVSSVPAGLTLVQSRTRAGLAPGVAGVASVVSAVGVCGRGAVLDAEVVLQVQPNAGACQEAAGAVGG